MTERAFTFRDWQRLRPDEAAAEVHRRVQALLSPEQRRAAIASLAPPVVLEARFASASPSGPLRGIPYFVKDIFPVAGEPMLAGSVFLPEVRKPSVSDASIIGALAGKGAVLAGRAHLHEFAYGITGENPHYGDCERPRFPGRTSGGSSSGSAALVSAGVVPFAVGTDTGGSVRLPAAFCGLFGFRLRPGHAWISDAFPLAPSFDAAGWFTATAGDMLAANEAILIQEPAGPHRGCFLEMPGIDADVALACWSAAQRLAPPADLQTASELLGAFRAASEAYGIIVADEAWSTHRGWVDRFADRYDPNVRQRLERGRSLTEADRMRAHKAVESVCDVWERFFQSHDFLVMPAAPFAALRKAECTLENRNRILALTAPASVAGLPVLTIPVPLSSGLTAGLQVVVKRPSSGVVPSILAALSA